MGDAADERTTPPAAHARVRQQARSQFDKWALSYDRSLLNKIVFFPTIRACQEEILRWQAGRGDAPYDVLDVGCGTASLIHLLARAPHARRLIGLDYSPVMIRRAGAKLAGSPQREKLGLVIADSERLPFAAGSFDVVTCCNSFHHYPHQPAVLRGFQRVLRPGGLLVLVDGFRDNALGWFVFDVCVTLVERHVHHAAWWRVRDLLRLARFATWRQRKLNVLAPLLVSVATR